LAASYLDILKLAIPLIMVEQVGSACLRGAGDTMAGLLAKLVAVIINLVVSTTLLLGLGGLPSIGWPALALGAACGHGTAGLMILAFLIRGRAGLRLRLRDLRPDPQLLGRLLRVGIPAGADILIVLGCHLTYLAIINRLGDADAAAHGLGIQIEALSYLPGSAFAVAAATVAGQFLGAGDPRRAARGALAACCVGGAIMTAAGTLFYFGGQYLTVFFTGHWQDPTGLYATALLRIVAVSAPSLAVTMILTGALRGAGDTVWPLVFTLAGLLCVRLPGACWLAWDTIPLPWLGLTLTGLGWGVAGAWCAMVADVVLRSVLVLIRFEQGGWQRVRV
jgi:putative MATE family efflux protein